MDTFSITDLRQKTSQVLSSAKQHGYVSVVKNSQKDAYVVDADYFKAMLEAHDEYLDMMEFDAGVKSLKKGKTIPLDQI